MYGWIYSLKLAPNDSFWRNFSWQFYLLPEKFPTKYFFALFCWRSLMFDIWTTAFWETFYGNFIYSQSFFHIFVKRKSPTKYFFVLFCWRYLIWGMNLGFTSNKSTHCLLDYGGCIRNVTTKSVKSEILIVASNISATS